MGTSVVIMGTLGVCAFLGAGMGLSALFQIFHEFKPSKKKGGESDGVGNDIREKAKSIS